MKYYYYYGLKSCQSYLFFFVIYAPDFYHFIVNLTSLAASDRYRNKLAWSGRYSVFSGASVLQQIGIPESVFSFSSHQSLSAPKICGFFYIITAYCSITE